MTSTQGRWREDGTRENEHKRDVKTLVEKNYTRSKKKDTPMEVHPTAITDHVAKENLHRLGRCEVPG